MVMNKDREIVENLKVREYVLYVTMFLLTC